MQRDLELVALLPAASDTTLGLAGAMCSLMGSSHKYVPANRKAVELTREALARYERLVLAMALVMVTWHEGVSDAEARAMLAGLVAGVRT